MHARLSLAELNTVSAQNSRKGLYPLLRTVLPCRLRGSCPPVLSRESFIARLSPAPLDIWSSHKLQRTGEIRRLHMVDVGGPGPSDPDSDDDSSKSRSGFLPKPKRCDPSSTKSVKAFLTKFKALLDDRDQLELLLRGPPTFECSCRRG